MRVVFAIILIINLLCSYMVFFGAHYSLTLRTNFYNGLKEDLKDTSQVAREYAKEHIPKIEYTLPEMRGQEQNVKWKFWLDMGLTGFFYNAMVGKA